MAQPDPPERRHPQKLRLTRRRGETRRAPEPLKWEPSESAVPQTGTSETGTFESHEPDAAEALGAQVNVAAATTGEASASEAGSRGADAPQADRTQAGATEPGVGSGTRTPDADSTEPGAPTAGVAPPGTTRSTGKKSRKATRAARQAQRTSEPEPEPRIAFHGQGWRVIAAKEFADHILSVRFIVLLLLVGIATIAAVYTAANGISSAASQASGTPALFLQLFTAAPQQLPPFFVLIGFLAPLLGIAFGFDAVNGERAQGTLSRLLAQPIHRDDVVNGKFVAGLSVIGLILTVITALVAGIGMVRLGIVPSPDDLTRIILWLIVAVLYVGFWLAFSILCSIVLRRAATSALTAIAVWLVLTLFAALLVSIVVGVLAPLPAQPTLADAVNNAQLQVLLSSISPGTLYGDVTAVLLDPTVRSVGIVLPSQTSQAVPSILPIEQSLLVAWPQLVALVALTVICFAAAYALFMRQEVRA